MCIITTIINNKYPYFIIVMIEHPNDLECCQDKNTDSSLQLFSGRTHKVHTLPVGGALSQIAALEVSLDEKLALRPDQIICYAIAAPRTGNHAFSHAYNKAVPHTWNVINDQVLLYLILGICTLRLQPRLQIPDRDS